MDNTVSKLNHVLADTYTLYLKTQNYHWNVTGVHFNTLHRLFGQQYAALALAVDEVAERIRALNALAPATYKEFEQLTSIKDGDSGYTAQEMVECLYKSHERIVETLKEALEQAENESDVFTVDLLTARIGTHEKDAWMLSATMESAPWQLKKAA